jgi:Increased loss of mitochondrial DNA protein 1
MALISAMTIITSLSLFHITLAYFFLTNPNQIADQTLVFILGEAMGMVNNSLVPIPLNPKN